MANIPLILHIPHASTHIPPEVRPTLLPDDNQLAAEVLSYTDMYTDELFSAYTASFASAVAFPVNRLVVDPERFPDDNEEPMASHGMGAVYLRMLDGSPLRNPLHQGERQKLLDTYYFPHHQRLTRRVEQQLAEAGSCLIIDCHSLPEHPFPFEANKSRVRPEICIGTDSFHTPAALSGIAAEIFREAGYTVDYNHPFSGTLVPLQYYQQAPRVFSLMIEINRKCYMDEKTGHKHGGFTVLQRQLPGILQLIQKAAGKSVYDCIPAGN